MLKISEVGDETHQEEEEEGANPAIAIFRRKASKEEAMIGLNSLKLHIKITSSKINGLNEEED